MNINLHIGAHKTATTFIQDSITSNLELVNAEGIGFMPLGDFRRTYTQELPKLLPRDFALAHLRQRFFPAKHVRDIKGIVISDENLVGSPVEFVRTGAPLHNIRYRIGLLKNLLAEYDVKVFLAIRSYDSFFTSNYCEFLIHSREFVRFSDFAGKIDLAKARWTHILEPVAEAFGPENVRLWRYEDFRDNAASIIRSLAFGIEMPIQQDVFPRASFSQIAIDVLTMIADKQGSTVAAKSIPRIGEILPKAGLVEAFDPWSTAQREKLRALYKEDCRSLSHLIERSANILSLPSTTTEERTCNLGATTWSKPPVS